MFNRLYGINRPRAKQLAKSIAESVPYRYKRSLADIVRTIHLNMPGYGLLWILVTDELSVRLTIIFGILVLMAFYVNGGCVVTDFELALNPEGDMIVDPVLTLCDIPITKATRTEATLAFINGALAIAFIIYVMRFC